MSGGIEETWVWYPFKHIGIIHSALGINVPTILNTWAALAALGVAIGVARYFLRYHSTREDAPDLSTHAYATYIIKAYIKSFMNLVEQTAGTFVYRYFIFIASLFTFILFCNWIALLPFAEEPTQDINTTLALGLTAFFYIQKEVIRLRGLATYLKEYFLSVETFFPLNIIVGLAAFPLKVLEEVSSVVSLSFRLFGNIFGGATIISLFHEMLNNSLLYHTAATVSGLHIVLALFFVLFEGGLQAFVFSILTLTNITMATSEEGH